LTSSHQNDAPHIYLAFEWPASALDGIWDRVLAANGREPVFRPFLWLVILAIPAIAIWLIGSGAFNARTPIEDKFRTLLTLPIRLRRSTRVLQAVTVSAGVFGATLVVLGVTAGLSHGVYQVGGRYYASPGGIVVQISKEEFYRMSVGAMRFEAGILILMYTLLFAYSVAEPHSARTR
jgi:hypothetical protein